MSKLTRELADLAEMLINMKNDLGLKNINPTEAHVLLMVIREYEMSGNCSMLKAVVVSRKSRSTVYKAIRKLTKAGIVKIKNSLEDKRSFLVIPKI